MSPAFLPYPDGKGLFFSCLKHGHMSKSCRERLCCQVCSSLHPTIVHMTRRCNRTKKQSCNSLDFAVISAMVCAENKMCGVTGAGEEECILSIVPVRVKTTKGNKTVEMVNAFLDPGSTDCFCTETLLNQLEASGRRTSILLRTMGDERPVHTPVDRVRSGSQRFV